MQRIAIQFNPRDRELFMTAWSKGHEVAVTAVNQTLGCQSTIKLLESPVEHFILVEFNRVVLGFDWQKWLRDIHWMGIMSAPILWDQPIPAEAVEVTA